MIIDTNVYLSAPRFFFIDQNSQDPTDGAYFAGLHEKYAPKVMNLLVKQGLSGSTKGCVICVMISLTNTLITMANQEDMGIKK